MIVVDQFKGKKILVFGLARSGLAAVESLVRGGADVYAGDDDPQKIAVAVEMGAKSFQLDSKITFEALVLSPGIPLTHPVPHAIVTFAKNNRIPIISDIELLGLAQSKARYIGITGTNGKSTTTTLIAHLLKQAGRMVQVGGNLGQAALTLEPLDANGIYVLELSSYQLELIPHHKMNIAVFLNITPDHLDRHGTMEGYVRAKMNIFNNKAKEDTAIVAIDDEYTQKCFDQLQKKSAQNLIAISTNQKLASGISVSNGVLFDSGHEVIDLKLISTLPGAHNWQNAAAAFATAQAAGLSREEIVQGLKSFKGLAHRQELILDTGQVRFINDSKATNPEAAEKALACYDNIYWILGGKPKSDQLDVCAPHFHKINEAFLIGQAADLFQRILSPKMKTTMSKTLTQAVTDAFQSARAKGGVVLLSPACASFDQFRDFEHRGNEFRRLVEELIIEQKATA